MPAFMRRSFARGATADGDLLLIRPSRHQIGDRQNGPASSSLDSATPPRASLDSPILLIWLLSNQATCVAPPPAAAKGECYGRSPLRRVDEILRSSSIATRRSLRRPGAGLPPLLVCVERLRPQQLQVKSRRRLWLSDAPMPSRGHAGRRHPHPSGAHPPGATPLRRLQLPRCAVCRRRRRLRHGSRLLRWILCGDRDRKSL
jgi:hypothetical protein